MYKYSLYFTNTLLVCDNPLSAVVVQQTEVLPDLETPFNIFYNSTNLSV